MKKIASLLSLTILSLTAWSQSTFQKTYGGQSGMEDIAYSIEQTYDGGYIVAGHTEDLGAQQRDILLIKLDGSGDTLWSKMYGGTFDERAYSVIETMDSGFVVVGRVDVLGDDDVLVMKTNSIGDVLWTKNYGSSFNEQANDVVENSDSTLAVAGWTDGLGAGGKDAYILKLNTSGDTLWTRTYGAGGEDELEAIATSVNGGFIVAGSSNSWSANKAYILRLDGNGDTLWTKLFGGNSGEWAYSVEENPADSGWIVGGHTQSYGIGGADMFLAKVTYSGSLSWFKTYGTSMDDYGYAVKPTTDNGFILAGASFDGGAADVLVVKTNSVGDTVWTKGFGTNSEDAAYDVQLTSDGGYILCGTYFDINAQNEEFYVLKINSVGKAVGCQTIGLTIFSTSPTPSTDLPSASLMGMGGTFGLSFLTVDNVSPDYIDYTMVLTFVETLPSCSGDSNGTAAVIVTCGIPPYSYLWDNADTTDTLVNLAAGTYVVTVTDAGGTTVVDSATVSDPTLLEVSADMTGFTLCDSLCTGVADAMESGGSGGYTFLWDNAAGNQTSFQADSLCLGTYFVTLTDVNGCTAVDSAVISSDPGGFMNPTTTVITSAACSTACNASVMVDGQGIPPLTFLWDDAGAQTSDTATGLCVGTYVVKVWDFQGCIEFDTVSVIAAGDTMSLVTIGYDRTCNIWCDGSAGLGIAGNIPGPFQYIWDDPQAQTTDSPDSLCAGTYTVIFSDMNGCFSFTDSVTINNSFSSLQLMIDSFAASCAGVCDGEAMVSANGGFPADTWLWNDLSLQSTETATGLCAGTYTVIVTEPSGCTRDTASVIIADLVPTITLSLSSTNVICNGICDGTTMVSATATYPPVSYLWNDPSAQTTDTATGLCPGEHIVSVTDALGCLTVSDTVTVGTDPFIPEPICVITVDSTSTKNVIVWEKPATAGIDSFKIYRDIVGTYTLVGSQPYSDVTFFEDTSSGVNPTITSYRYKISTVDTCGVESTLSAFHKTIHLQVVPGVPPAMQLSWDDYEGFSLTFYRILRDTTGLGNWEKIDSTSFGINSLTDPNPPQTGFLRYIVEVVAPAECVATKQKNFNSSKSNTAASGPPPALSVNASATSASANTCDATGTATEAGGAPPYVYSWNTTPVQTNATAFGLCGDTYYTVVVTDANNDTATDSVYISELTSISEAELHSLFDIYPNPNTGSFNVALDLRGSESWSLKIFNVLGSEVQSEYLGVVNGNLLKTVELHDATVGVYYVQLANDKVSIRKKVVIY